MASGSGVGAKCRLCQRGVHEYPPHAPNCPNNKPEPDDDLQLPTPEWLNASMAAVMPFAPVPMGRDSPSDQTNETRWGLSEDEINQAMINLVATAAPRRNEGLANNENAVPAAARQDNQQRPPTKLASLILSLK